MSLQDTLDAQLRLRDDRGEVTPGADEGVAFEGSSRPSEPSVSTCVPASSSSSKPPRSRPPRIDSPAVQLSKALSYLLRHGAAKEGLKMRPDGYVLVSDILARPKVSKLDLDGEGRSPTLEDIRRATEDNEKKRFEMRQDEGPSGEWWIRATQGHSLKEVTDVDMMPVTLDNYIELLSLPSSSSSLPTPAKPTVLHGTTTEAWDMIRNAGGLSRMGRNHIHLAKGRPGQNGVISGMRASSSVLLHIDIERALRDGVSFLVASNGAVLTPGIKMEQPAPAASTGVQGVEDGAPAAPVSQGATATREHAPPAAPRAIQPPEDPEEKKRRREAAKKEKKERKMGGSKAVAAEGDKVDRHKKQQQQQAKGGKKGVGEVDWEGMLPLKYVTMAEGKKGRILWRSEE